MRLSQALALAVLAACGGSGIPAGNGIDAGASSSCQVTLSGAATGTFSCLITLAYTSQNDRTTFGFDVAMPAPLQMISGQATRSGTPAAQQTWTGSDSTGTGTFFVQAPGGSWLSSSGTATAQGSYSLTFLPGSGTIYNNITTYAKPTGTFTATLPAGPGTATAGTVMMSASF